MNFVTRGKHEPGSWAAAHDQDIPTRQVSEDELHEAAAVADGLTVVEAPKAIDVVQQKGGAGPVVEVDRSQFERIQAEHAAAAAFKAVHREGYDE